MLAFNGFAFGRKNKQKELKDSKTKMSTFVIQIKGFITLKLK
jgi:hypothetical protein